MLDWLILFALHLQYLNKGATDAVGAVKTLIHNVHYVLFGFLKDVATDFTLTNPNFYIVSVNTLLTNHIFSNPSLLRIVTGIKKFLREYSTENQYLSTYLPRQPIRRTTVKLGGNNRKSDKLTRKRRHQDKIHNFSHTIKVAQKSSINTKKTRRNPHMHHPQVLVKT
jgi:hypothetical protein